MTDGQTPMPLPQFPPLPLLTAEKRSVGKPLCDSPAMFIITAINIHHLHFESFFLNCHDFPVSLHLTNNCSIRRY